MATKNTTLIPIIYSDFRTDFAPHPVTEDLIAQTNVDAVIRSIRSLLFTRPYERFRQPKLGSGLTAYLFEPISPVTEDAIRQAITSTINNYEPRARLLEVYVSAQPDENAYSATIVFNVVNIEAPIKFTTILQRIR